jgi:hypothetical protein
MYGCGSGGRCILRVRRRLRMWWRWTCWRVGTVWRGEECKKRRTDVVFQKFMIMDASGFKSRVSLPHWHRTALITIPSFPFFPPFLLKNHNGPTTERRRSRPPTMYVPSLPRLTLTDPPAVQRRIPDYIALHESVSVCPPVSSLHLVATPLKHLRKPSKSQVHPS